MDEYLEIKELILSIDCDAKISLEDNHDAVAIYLKFWNSSMKKKEIKIESLFYITRTREQVEENCHLKGYANREVVLRKDTCDLYVSLFFDTRVKKTESGDQFEITISLPQDGIKATAIFEKKDTTWFLYNSEIEEIKVEVSPKQVETKLLKRVEKFEVMEEQLGIIISNVSFNLKSPFKHLYCEVTSTKGTKIESTIKINCSLYDDKNKIICLKTETLYSSYFYGFEILDFGFCSEEFNDVSKIRIFPTK